MLFQGKDGNLVRDKCVHICQKRDCLSSSKSSNKVHKQVNKPSSLDDLFCSPVNANAVDITETPTEPTPKLSYNVEATNQSSLWTSCHCPCGILAADLEGAMLGIVILRNRIDSIANSKVGDSSKENDEINRLQREVSDEKEKTKKLESHVRLIVRERNSEVEELKQIISSLENKVAENVETNNSLGLAIKLIMQDNTVNINKGNQCSLDQNPWIFTNKKS